MIAARAAYYMLLYICWFGLLRFTCNWCRS
jgi:hypothetical protein